MMTVSTQKYILMLAVSMSSIAGSQAESGSALSIAQSIDWSADLSIGAEHDSSVVIDDIDFFSRRGDTALTMRGKFTGAWKQGKQTAWKGDYIFHQRTYADLSNFDQQSHLFRMGVESKRGAWRFGMDVRYANADIGRAPFLDATHISPNISRFFGADWFGQVRYTYAKERYSGRASRNAEKHRADVDLYYFLDGPKSYLIFGLDAQTSDAELNEFGYESVGPSISYIKQADLLGRQVKFNLRWRYENRTYDDVSVLIGETREDERHRVNAEARLMLGRGIYLAGDFRLGDYRSNLIDADYQEEVVGLKIGRAF